MALFPRKIFNDSLPRIIMKHQLYSLHSAKTLVDRQLVSDLQTNYVKGDLQA